MKRTIRTEEQIIGILQEHEAGAKCADLCRKHGMTEGTFYAWKGLCCANRLMGGVPLSPDRPILRAA